MYRVVVALIAAACAAASARGQVTYRSGIDLVSFGVTVTDRKGAFVKDLTAADFEVYEDGQKQDLRYFSNGSVTGSEETPELHLGIVFDISGSMDEDLRLARTAAIRFLNTLREAVDITLVDFTTEVRVARYGQNDFPRVVERIRNRKADGYTALYDAVGVYLDGASHQGGRTVMVLYTDGADNSSELPFDELLTLLRASDIIVYSIGFVEHQAGSSARMDLRVRLRELAEVTGGQAFFPASAKDLDGVYQKIEEEIRAQYVMGYVSTNTRQDGKWRKVEIRVVRPGFANVVIRTRGGYFAPYKEPAREGRLLR
ncbi:MAG: VWA domain-containing protein [Vicinamibacterales bacterium]